MKSLKIKDVLKALDSVIKTSELNQNAKNGLIQFRESIEDFEPNSELLLDSIIAILADDVSNFSGDKK